MDLKTSLLHHPSTKLHETPKALPQPGRRQELEHKASPGPAHFPFCWELPLQYWDTQLPQVLRAEDEPVRPTPPAGSWAPLGEPGERAASAPSPSDTQLYPTRNGYDGFLQFFKLLANSKICYSLPHLFPRRMCSCSLLLA